jgi:hypothetical protein|tara:strand:- start:3441 stop:4376 length:936 start_codon:yes stop_codon:yes gene_type:complete
MIETLLPAIGVFFAGAAVLSNDAVQTLGTFMSSNKKISWQKLWLAASSVMVLTITWGWYHNGGDISFGRLDSIPHVTIQWYHAGVPAILLILTRLGIPVSTTFLVLSAFSTAVMFEKMLVKSMVGYAIAACSAYGFWIMLANFIDEKKKVPKEQKKYWRFAQWVTTGFLWFTWITHDMANIAVFLPRQISVETLICVLVFLSSVLAFTFKSGGGKIQEIVSKKSSTSYVRSATIIDFIYAIILLVFKEWSNVPMSTTWVFVGLLCGRELAIATWYNRKIKRVFPLIARDFLKVMMGLAVSVVVVLLIQGVP